MPEPAAGECPAGVCSWVERWHGERMLRRSSVLPALPEWNGVGVAGCSCARCWVLRGRVFFRFFGPGPFRSRPGLPPSNLPRARAGGGLGEGPPEC